LPHPVQSRSLSSGVWCHAVWYVDAKMFMNTLALASKPKWHRYLFTKLNGVTIKTTAFSLLITLRTSNLTYDKDCINFTNMRIPFT
jgi:hypothetical protein